MSPQTQKIGVTLMVLAIVGIGAYFLFFRDSVTVPAEVVMTEDEQSVSQKILMLTEKLNTLSIDTAFFASPLFTNLRDISYAPTPEPVGRPNPFAFIGTDNAVSVPETTTAATTTAPKKPR